MGAAGQEIEAAWWVGLGSEGLAGMPRAGAPGGRLEADPLPLPPQHGAAGALGQRMGALQGTDGGQGQLRDKAKRVKQPPPPARGTAEDPLNIVNQQVCSRRGREGEKSGGGG